MTVRRTPQHDAVLELRQALAEAGRALMDTDPEVLPGVLVDAREGVVRAWDRAVTVGVGR